MRTFRDLTLFDWVLVYGVTVCTILYSVFTSDGILGFDWLGTVAALTGILSVVLTTHRNVLTYAFGLVNVVAYAVISYKSNLLGDCLLYFLYYLPMQFWGWVAWTRHSIDEERTIVIPARMTKKERLAVGLTSALAVVTFGLLLSWLKTLAADNTFIMNWHLFSEYPFRDSVTTVFAVMGQYLMVKAYREQWFFWIAVDVVSISIWGLMALQGMPHATIMLIMYVFYLANCVNGARLWRKDSCTIQ